jgi:hypothetical protein
VPENVEIKGGVRSPAFFMRCLAMALLAPKRHVSKGLYTGMKKPAAARGQGGLIFYAEIRPITRQLFACPCQLLP